MKRAIKLRVLTEVNANILEVAKESPLATSPWEFFCECG